MSCFWSFIWKVAHPVSDRTQPCLTSVKLMELAGPLGHSPRKPLVQFVWHLVVLKSYPLLFSKIKDRCAIGEKLASEIDAI